MDQVTLEFVASAAGVLAVTQCLKQYFPEIRGAWTLLTALILGVVANGALAGFDLASVQDWVTAGILAGLSASGVAATASKIKPENARVSEVDGSGVHAATPAGNVGRLASVEEPGEAPAVGSMENREAGKPSGRRAAEN
ncbi:hypothetical protein ACU19_04980 [Actinobaculum suis]|uniref:hypothetical protein n=1 Tax=Actinobaculum suis TaxID=1657 RepID=UPI00066FBF88|nr:hypothetical protein [Actinobaculum suis]KMY23327.1 hypothetical protein ACU19_04980 [Actinobaculum suis]